ncbi:hypothetical protein CUMW_068350 [Citrus unshiu]|nr:hypothetical protein CUMW_068350 [Citrus unshiu]
MVAQEDSSVRVRLEVVNCGPLKPEPRQQQQIFFGSVSTNIFLVVTIMPLVAKFYCGSLSGLKAKPRSHHSGHMCEVSE